MRRTAPTPALVLALAAALALALLFAPWPSRRGAGARRAAPRGPVATGARGGSGKDGSRAADGSVRAAREPRAQELPAAPDQQVGVDRRVPYRPAPEPGLRVIVVDAQTRAPVPGAEVRLMGPGREAAGLLDPSALADRVGRGGRADERGELVLERPADRALLVGWTAERFGLWPIARETRSPLSLALGPSPPLRVRVLDAADAPARGIGVMLSVEAGLGPGMGGLLLQEGTSDGEGRLRFPHAWSRLPRAGWRPIRAATLLLSVQPELVGAASVPAPADPREELLLRLPPTGALEVRAVEIDGTPVADDGRITLFSRDVAPDESSAQSVTLRAGRALFDPVPLGRAFVLDVFTARHEPLSRRVPGPTRPGEHALLSLTLTRAPELSGRFVDASGAPLAGRTFELRLGETWRAATSDADGSFRVVVPGGTGLAGGELEVIATDAPARALIGGRFPLSLPLARGVRDLGVLRLAPLPVLAAGHVTWEDGEPAAGARVALSSTVLGHAPASSTEGDVADGDGAFRLRGFEDELLSEPELFADHPEAAGEVRLAFTAGAGDLSPVLTRGATLIGRVLLDPGASAYDLDVRAGPERDLREDPWVDPETFRLRVPPGRWTVEVRAAGALVAAVPDVVVSPGIARDPRLDPLDLRGRLPVAEAGERSLPASGAR